MNMNSTEVISKLFAKTADLKLSNEIVFVFDNSTQLSAKDLLILVKNKKFSQIFTSTSPDDLKTIEVHDIESNIFLNIIRFVYNGDLIKDLADLSSTYLAAERHGINNLCEILLEYADKKLSIYNSIILYDQYLKIDEFDESKLGEIVGIINIHAYLAFQSVEFTNISRTTLIKILESDDLFIREKDLYYACLKWLKAELLRRNLNDNPENRLLIFNVVKHLIRFPIMTKGQFYASDQEAPHKSGLFNETELKEFEEYFETNDSTLLTVNYSTKERCQLNIARLELKINKLTKNEKNDTADDYVDSQFEFVMSKIVDDTFFCDGLETKNNETCVIRSGNNYASVSNECNKEIKSPKLTNKARKRNLACDSFASIRVFRIDVSGNSFDWHNGCHLVILEDNKKISAFYERFRMEKSYGYYDYHPTFEMKQGKLYTFRFVCPGEGNCETSFKLDNVYTKNEEDELILDVKFTIRGSLSWTHPKKIIFIYK